MQRRKRRATRLLAHEWRREFATLQQSKGQLNALLRMPSQGFRECYFFTACRTEVEDVAARNRTMAHFFQTERLGAELYVVVEPFAHLAFFIFNGRQLTILFFYHVRKAAQVQML